MGKDRPCCIHSKDPGPSLGLRHPQPPHSSSRCCLFSTFLLSIYCMQSMARSRLQISESFRGTSGGQGTSLLFPRVRSLPSHPPYLPLCSISPHHSVIPRTVHAFLLPYPSPHCSHCQATPSSSPFKATQNMPSSGRPTRIPSLSPSGPHDPLDTPHPTTKPVLQLSGFVLAPPLTQEHQAHGKNHQGDSLLCPQHHLASGCAQTAD